MARFRTWLLLPALLLAVACDRLAGTEVGNPEITVAARFGIRGTGSTMAIPEMNLKVMGMGWTMAGDSGACWNEPEGHMVDFAAEGAEPLPAVKVKNGDWSQAEMMLQAPGGNGTLPDSVAFSGWSNPRYIKLVKVMGADTVRALFELPADLKLKLGFGKATIADWRDDHHMTVDVIFDADKWAAGLAIGSVAVYRKDGAGARYAVLSPEENPDAYAALEALLPMSFMCDTVDMF
jgi:hypothetical protein